MTAGGGTGYLSSIFETMRVRNGRIPLLHRHVERLVGSCPVADLLPPPRDLATHAAAHALRPPADRILRLEWNSLTLTWDDREWRPLTRLRLAVSRVVHPGYPIKSTDRRAFDRAAAEAAEGDADEPLLLTADGLIAETARFAVAWFEGDVLRVPDLRLDILPSIGRIRLMELAEARRIRVESGRWPADVLADRPIFLVNAARGVVPVSALNGRAVPRDARIPVLADAFWPQT